MLLVPPFLFPFEAFWGQAHVGRWGVCASDYGLDSAAEGMNPLSQEVTPAAQRDGRNDHPEAASRTRKLSPICVFTPQSHSLVYGCHSTAQIPVPPPRQRTSRLPATDWRHARPRPPLHGGVLASLAATCADDVPVVLLSWLSSACCLADLFYTALAAAHAAGMLCERRPHLSATGNSRLCCSRISRCAALDMETSH